MDMLIELLGAIQDIPQVIHQWERHQADDIVTHLSRFDHGKWRAIVDCDKVLVPDLVGYFNDHI